MAEEPTLSCVSDVDFVYRVLRVEGLSVALDSIGPAIEGQQSYPASISKSI